MWIQYTRVSCTIDGVLRQLDQLRRTLAAVIRIRGMRVQPDSGSGTGFARGTVTSLPFQVVMSHAALGVDPLPASAAVPLLPRLG